jgi:type I restriction enzyme M protein
MDSQSTNINPELIKLQQASQKAFGEIRKQTSDETAYLYFYLTLLLLKDNLLPEVSYEVTENLSDLKVNLLPEIYNPKRKEVYRKIIERLDSLERYPLFLILCINSLKKIDISLLSQNEIADFFEYLLKKRFHVVKKRRSSVLFPREIIDLIDFLDQRSGKDIYNPFSRYGDFSLCKNYKYIYSQESHSFDYTIHLIRILMHNLEERVNIEYINPTRTWDHKDITNKFDLIISMPPIGAIPKKSLYDELFPKNDNISISLRVKTYEEQFFDSLLFRRLNPEGKVISIVSQGFLISDSKSKKYRQEWIDSGYLKVIVALPNLSDFTNTSIQLYLIVLDTTPTNNGNLRYIDGRNLYNKSDSIYFNLIDFKSLYVSSTEMPGLKFIDYNLLRTNDYDLQVDNCFRGTRAGIKLIDICNEIRNLKRGDFNSNGRIVRNRDLKTDKNDFLLDVSSLEFDHLDGEYELSESCLLITRFGAKIKPTYFNYTGESIYITQGIIPLKIDESKVDINYLINELYQDYVLEQINASSTGEVIPIFDRKKLLAIHIDIDKSIAEQRALINKIKSSHSLEIQQTSEQIDLLRKEIYEDIRKKEHNILQHIADCASALRLLKNYLQKDQVVDAKCLSDVNKRIDSLSKSLSSATSEITLLTKEITAEVKKEIDINELILKCIDLCSKNDDLFSIEYSFDEDSFKIPISERQDKFLKINPHIFIAPNLFSIVFNNILANAKRHSFKPEDKKYIFRIVLSCGRGVEFSDKILIHFLISGNPFEEGSADSYCVRGAKAGPYANTGFGAAEVCEIVRNHFEGSIEVIDEKESSFPVQFKIRIPISGWEQNKN